MGNPKTEPTDNMQKNPDQWVSGDDPIPVHGLFCEDLMRAGRRPKEVQRKSDQG